MSPNTKNPGSLHAYILTKWFLSYSRRTTTQATAIRSMLYPAVWRCASGGYFLSYRCLNDFSAVVIKNITKSNVGKK